MKEVCLDRECTRTYPCGKCRGIKEKGLVERVKAFQEMMVGSPSVEEFIDNRERSPKDHAIRGGTKNDTGKPEYDRLSFQALGQFNAVHKFGDKKYNKGDWKEGLHFTRLLNAVIRHTSAMLSGELFDKESGLLHSAHAGVCLEMVTHFLLNHQEYKDFDDLTNDKT
jgi:hypothetical protein